MSADQIERAAQLEQDAIDAAYERGELTAEQYRQQTREIERQCRDELREECEREMDDVRGNYGF